MHPYSRTGFFNLLSDNEQRLVDHDDTLVLYLMKYLDHMKCGTVLIEERYVDKDFMDDYANFYSTCFKDYDKYCTRIHFFVNFSEAKFKRFIEKGLAADEVSGFIDELNSEYIGFSVIRPLPWTVVGRTVFRTYELTVSEGEDKPRRRSIRCVRDYKVNLFGLSLCLKGLAFLEQDRGVAACATAALWYAFQKTAHEHGYSIPSLFDITKSATKYLQFGRSIPTSGLHVEQMISAVSATGLDPEYNTILAYNEDSSSLTWTYNYPLLAASYGYLRSGIPIVLNVMLEDTRGNKLGGHAFALVGYRITPKGPKFDEVGEWTSAIRNIPKIKLKASRLLNLYAHDDGIGPYCKLWVKKYKKSPYPMFLKGTWEIGGKECHLVPHSMIVPLYHKIRVPFVSAYKLAAVLDSLIREETSEFDFEWDIFLTSVNDYRASLADRIDFPRRIRKKMLERSHPRFIWRARGFSRGEEVCEMLADATDAECSFQPYSLNTLNEDLSDMFKSNHSGMMRDYAGVPLVRKFIELAATKSNQ